MDDARAALDPFIQLEVKLRRVLDDHPAREQILKLRPFALELVDDVFALFLRSDHRHVDVGVLEVWSYVNLLDCNKLGIKDDLLPEKVAQLPANQLVYTFEAVLSHGLKFPGLSGRLSRQRVGVGSARHSTQMFPGSELLGELL